MVLVPWFPVLVPWLDLWTFGPVDLWTAGTIPTLTIDDRLTIDSLDDVDEKK